MFCLEHAQDCRAQQSIHARCPHAGMLINRSAHVAYDVCLCWGRKTRRPQESSELLRNIGGIVAVNLVLAASQDSAIDNLGAHLAHTLASIEGRPE